MEGGWFYRYRIRNWYQCSRKTESKGPVAHSLQSYLVGRSETSGVIMKKVGDLVWCRWWKMGIVVDVDWRTDIGTPFDYAVFYFDINRIEGTDDWDLEMEVFS